MAHDDAVRRHRLEIARGVEQSFTFADTRSWYADVDRVSRETLSRDFKRSARSRGRFEEEIDNCAATECRHLLDVASRNIAKRFGRIEQVRDFACFKLANA